MIYQVNLVEDILTKTFVIYPELGSDTIFVETNPCEVEIVKISKVNSNISHTKEKNTFSLNHFVSHSTDLSESPMTLAKKLNKYMINCVNNTTDIEVINVKEKKILGLITKNNLIKLKESIQYFDWIIAHNSLKDDFSKLTDFNLIIEEVGSLRRLGKYCNVSVFLSGDLDKNTIIAGNSESIKSVFLNDISIEKKSNIYEIGIDYLFNYTGIRKLILE